MIYLAPVSYQKAGNGYLVTEDAHYFVGSHEGRLPAGFYSDGPSIPKCRLLRRVIPPEAIVGECLLHDWLRIIKFGTRDTTDVILRDLLKDRLGTARAFFVYAGLKIGIYVLDFSYTPDFIDLQEAKKLCIKENLPLYYYSSQHTPDYFPGVRLSRTQFQHMDTSHLHTPPKL